ncbi:MAG: hypothetical protein ACI8WB_002007 [Phenylobacterium sp.]|jgi:hypothetical protein
MNRLALITTTSLLLSLSAHANLVEKKPLMQPHNNTHLIEVKYKQADGSYRYDQIEALEVNGDLVYGGDIIMGKVADLVQRKGKFSNDVEMNLVGASDGPGNTWQYSLVPYTLDGGFTNTEKTAILNAMAYMEARFGVNFDPRGSQSSYVHFTRNPTAGACGDSRLGMVGGKQNIRLDFNCFTQRTIVHEALHALGYMHEHQRKDRDSNITVNYSNLDTCRSQFNKDYNYNPTTSYDINSIMHYSSKTTEPCVHDESEPMFTKVGGGEVSSQSNLSSTDVNKLKNDYGYTFGTRIRWASMYCFGNGSLRWSSIKGATSYKIEKNNRGNWSHYKTTSSTEAKLRVNSSDNFRVVGVNANGERSALSNSVYIRNYGSCL